MNKIKTLYTTDRRAWRKWLSGHYKSAKEIWLVYPRKDSGKPRIEYNDAVEEALCFSWIDSQVRSIDKERYMQRFSPRKPKSSYSEANKQRLRILVQQGRVMPEIAASLAGILRKKFVIPPDIVAALRSNVAAWNNFRKFSPGYKRIRTAFIEAARSRPAEFKKRLVYFVRMTEKNKQFGFGGINKLY